MTLHNDIIGAREWRRQYWGERMAAPSAVAGVLVMNSVTSLSGELIGVDDRYVV